MKSLQKIVWTVFFITAIFFLSINNSDAKVKIGSGWSVNIEESKAVKEAVQRLKKDLPNPNFIYIMSASGYDNSIILNNLKNSFENSKIFGLEVSFAVFTQEGIHKGEKGSLAILGIDAPTWSIGVGATNLSATTTKKDIKTLATQAIHEAVYNAKKTMADKPSIILIAPAILKEEPILETLEEIFGEGVKVMGGTPGDSVVFANDSIIPGGFALAVIYSDTKVGVGYHAGVIIDKNLSGIVTEIGETSRHLKTIDNRPAFYVYNEWSGGLFNDIDIENIKEPLEIWKTAGRTPLAKLYNPADSSTSANVTVPIEILPDKSIIVGSDINVGDRIYYSLASRKSYIRRAGAIVTKALIDGRVKKRQLAGGIHVYCRDAAFGQIGKDAEKLQEIVFEMKKEMNGKPFIGGFTAGEQGNIKGYGSFHGNLSSSMIVFSEK